MTTDNLLPLMSNDTLAAIYCDLQSRWEELECDDKCDGPEGDSIFQTQNVVYDLLCSRVGRDAAMVTLDAKRGMSPA